MDAFSSLMSGFSAALTPTYIAMCFLGVLLGQIVGVLPGIGPAAAIALLLPITFGMDPTGAIIMFAGIYYGSQYGGTLTSVLISVPGESSTVMTAVDGYQMALQGRAGAALGISAIGSFIAGTIGTIGLILIAPALAKMALAFGPPEYFSLVLLGLMALAAVGGSLLKGLMTGLAGLALGTMGIDPQVGVPRFDFGQVWLLDGVEFIVLTVALFGLGEVLGGCNSSVARPVAKVSKVLPTRADWQQSRMPIMRGSVIGFIIGVWGWFGPTIAGRRAGQFWVFGRHGSGLWIIAEPVPQAVASALEGDDLGVVKEAVEDGRGTGHVAEELTPVFEWSVTGHDGASGLVAAHVDLEQVFAAPFPCRQ